MITRRVQKDVLEGAHSFPVVAIVGPRQSGKTTLARSLFDKHTYITLEDLDVRAAAIQDPRSFLLANRNNHGIIIDEFQYAPALLSYIQTIVDEEQKAGYFILTGSQNFLMNQAITQSLAGRISIHTLLPLAIDELSHAHLLPGEIETMLFNGCYPAIYAKNITPTRLYKNYVRTYIERDVRQITQVGDLTTFQTFITLCAARTGQILNMSSLGNECGISDVTVKRWLSVLEASYIIFLLHPFHTNIGKRLVKTPKIYFYDTGLACYLLKIKQHELASHPNRGNLFESLIIADIIKWHHNRGLEPSVYFWQDKSGHEIDCIVTHGSTMIPIEIKSGRTSSPRFFQGLKDWQLFHEQAEMHGYVIYTGSARQTRGHTQLVSWQKIDNALKEIE